MNTETGEIRQFDEIPDDGKWVELDEEMLKRLEAIEDQKKRLIEYNSMVNTRQARRAKARYGR